MQNAADAAEQVLVVLLDNTTSDIADVVLEKLPQDSDLKNIVR